jgi:hypothetical protein
VAEGVEGGVGCGVDEDGGGRREQEESEALSGAKYCVVGVDWEAELLEVSGRGSLSNELMLRRPSLGLRVRGTASSQGGPRGSRVGSTAALTTVLSSVFKVCPTQAVTEAFGLGAHAMEARGDGS